MSFALVGVGKNIRIAMENKKRSCSLRFVASSGIEPESGASETLILSIVRRGRVFVN